MAKFAFRTRDGITGIKDCPDMDEDATVAMAPLRDTHPSSREYDSVKREPTREYRKYEWHGEYHEGFKLLREV